MSFKSEEELAQVALDIANSAAKGVLERFRTVHSLGSKAGGELFTEVDLWSEEHVREGLTRYGFGLPVVGEEQGGTPGAGPTWFVDPIDGTHNFAAGHPIFAVSIGVMDGPSPLAGAIVAPALGLAWHGWVGGAAFRNGERCYVSSTSELSQCAMTTGHSFHPFPQQERLATLSRSVRDVRRCGSSACELAWVADGTYDFYWSPRCEPWDTSAGAALIIAAGGKFWQESSSMESDWATNGVIDSQLATLGVAPPR